VGVGESRGEKKGKKEGKKEKGERGVTRRAADELALSISS
jgi:hypothetical protein